MGPTARTPRIRQIAGPPCRPGAVRAQSRKDLSPQPRRPLGMRSFTQGSFWDACHALPDHIKIQANRAYTLFQANHDHPSLNFKRGRQAKPCLLGPHQRRIPGLGGDGIKRHHLVLDRPAPRVRPTPPAQLNPVRPHRPRMSIEPSVFQPQGSVTSPQEKQGPSPLPFSGLVDRLPQ